MGIPSGLWHEAKIPAHQRRGTTSGGPLEAHGVMRHVFVQIGENQKQFEHTVALLRAWFFGAVFKIFHGGKRIGKQPFEAFLGERRAFAAAGESEIGAHERFVEKMIQAQLRGGEGGRRGVCASGAVAMNGGGGCHRSSSRPQVVWGTTDAGESSIFFSVASGGEL